MKSINRKALKVGAKDAKSVNFMHFLCDLGF